MCRRAAVMGAFLAGAAVVVASAWVRTSTAGDAASGTSSRSDALAPRCAPIPGNAAARPGTIAFIRDGRLHLMNADGSGQCRAGTFADDYPVWSPDGRRIAFPVRGRLARLYVVDADGSDRRPLTPAGGHDCSSLAWSPDSRRIAFARNEGCEGVQAIFLVNADATGLRRLTSGADPVWFPDGRMILFRYGGMILMRPDGSKRRAIPRASVRDDSGGGSSRPQAAWSRDGNRIFFTGEGGGLSVMNVNGTDKRKLTLTLNVFRFALSPDQRHIALAADDGRIRDIYVMRADGRALRKLTSARGVINDDPQWSPDGRKLAFTRRIGFNGQTEIYAMNADGSALRNISRNPADDLAPAWAPTRR